MATIGVISITLTTSTAKFEAGLALARKELTKFGTESAKAINSAAKLGTKLAGSLGGLGALGAGVGLSKVVETAVEAESSIAKLAKVSDFSPEGLKEFKGELQGLSTEIKGVSIEDIYKIATEGSKLGVASGDLLEYTQGIAKLSVALDDIPADVLTNEIGKINVVFGLGVKGALQLGSAIDKVADSGVSSAADILDVTQRISGVAAAAKIGAPDAIALAGALLDTGTNAEAAGTALNKLIMKMSISEGQASFAKTLGISADEFAAKVKAGPAEALREWLAAVKRLNSEGQVHALQDVLGKKNTAQVAEIQKLASVVETAGTYAQQAAHEFETLDNINKSYAINAETTKSLLEQVGNQFKVLGDTIGGFFLPPLKVALEWINAVAGGISDLLKVNERLDAGVKKSAQARIDAYLESIGGEKKSAPKVDAKAEARRALVAKKAAEEAKAAAAEEGEPARELKKKELGDTSKSVGLAATFMLVQQQKAAERAGQLLEEARTPLEKYKDDLAEVNKLLADQIITQEQAAKLKGKLDKEENPFVEAGATVGGIAGEAGNAAFAKANERPKASLAGAMELGGQEARSTVLDYKLNQQGQQKGDIKSVATNTASTAKGVTGMAAILSKISAQLGGGANNTAPIPIG